MSTKVLAKMHTGWKRLARPGMLYGALAVAFCAPLFEHPSRLGIIDWDEKLAYYGAVLKSVLEYGQLPFWNPWKCGGGVLWQNPLVPLLSPMYGLATLMSVALAIKIEIVLHYWLGFIGMHLLLTEIIGLTFLPLVVYLASVYTLCGALAMHLQVGHSVFLPAFYFPWLLFFFLRAVKWGAIRDALFGGMFVALTIYNAGLHVMSMMVTTIAALAVVSALSLRSWTPIVLATALSVSGGLYAAPKLLPVTLFVAADQFLDTRGSAVHPDQMTAGMVLRSYLDPYQYGNMVVDSSQRWPWWEYANYIGLPAVLLIVSCVIWVLLKGRDRREAWLGWSLALTALLLLAWSAGEFSKLAPASLASHVWFISKFRAPSRFTIAFALIGTTLIGWTAKTLAIETTREARFFAGLVCALASLQLLTQNRSLFVDVFSVPPLERGFRPLHGPRTLMIDHTSDPYAPTSPMFRNLMNDTASYNCYESFQLTHAADADHPLVFTKGDANIVDVKFTPNHVEFSAVGGREPTTVLLNQNYGPGWRSNLGPVSVDPQSGKPAVVLASGQTGKFSFVFVAPGVLPGLLIMIASAILSSLVWKRRLR